MMKNIALALWAVIKAIIHNVVALFINRCLEMKAEFWDFVKAVLTGVKAVANLANKLLGVFGVEIDTSGLENKIREAESNAQANRDGKLDYESLGEAWNSQIHTYSAFEDGWASNAYAQGAAVGEGIQDTINNAYDSIANGLGNFNLGESLGVEGMPDLTDPSYQLNPTYSYDPSSVAGDIGDIADTGRTTAGNTSDIADAMELTEEDLEYLRKVAEMEWKKEFTTAQITVNMNNNNNINGDQDLDGIVTKLSSMLYEELGAVANGVYV